MHNRPPSTCGTSILIFVILATAVVCNQVRYHRRQRRTHSSWNMNVELLHCCRVVLGSGNDSGSGSGSGADVPSEAQLAASPTEPPPAKRPITAILLDLRRYTCTSVALRNTLQNGPVSITTIRYFTRYFIAVIYSTM